MTTARPTNPSPQNRKRSNAQIITSALRADMTTNRRNAAWCGKLGSLTRYRYGNHYLPDNSEGRAMLLGFLWCGLSTDNAKERAPWLTADELESLQLEARCLTLNELGKLIGLKNKERYDCRVFFLAASNVTPEEAARYQAERDRENARKRQMKLRQSREKMRHTIKRDEAVLRMLTTMPTPSSWTPVSALVTKAKRCDAFRRPDGRPLSNPRDAVHCVLKTLKTHDQIQMTEQAGARGMVCMVRLADWKRAERDIDSDALIGPENCPRNAERDVFSDGRSVVAKNRAKHQIIKRLCRRKSCHAGNTEPSTYQATNPPPRARWIGALPLWLPCRTHQP